MKKAEIVIRLRKMLDDIEAMPESLVGDDIYPLLRITFVNRGSPLAGHLDTERITLIVGATVEDDDES